MLALSAVYRTVEGFVRRFSLAFDQSVFARHRLSVFERICHTEHVIIGAAVRVCICGPVSDYRPVSRNRFLYIFRVLQDRIAVVELDAFYLPGFRYLLLKAGDIGVQERAEKYQNAGDRNEALPGGFEYPGALFYQHLRCKIAYECRDDHDEEDEREFLNIRRVFRDKASAEIIGGGQRTAEGQTVLEYRFQYLNGDDVRRGLHAALSVEAEREIREEQTNERVYRKHAHPLEGANHRFDRTVIVEKVVAFDSHLLLKIGGRGEKAQLSGSRRVSVEEDVEQLYEAFLHNRAGHQQDSVYGGQNNEAARELGREDRKGVIEDICKRHCRKPCKQKTRIYRSLGHLIDKHEKKDDDIYRDDRNKSRNVRGDKDRLSLNGKARDHSDGLLRVHEGKHAHGSSGTREDRDLCSGHRLPENLVAEAVAKTVIGSRELSGQR